MANPALEVWLRGSVAGVPPLLQPVAHALLQVREEVVTIMADFPADKLWERPVGVASVAFHLQHLTGVLDRLFTYARGETLTETQQMYLAAEGKPTHSSVQELIEAFGNQVDKALNQLKQTDEKTLPDPRGVGRAQVPSTVFGLLVHAAEHSTRHLGQLVVTASIVRVL